MYVHIIKIILFSTIIFFISQFTFVDAFFLHLHDFIFLTFLVGKNTRVFFFSGHAPSCQQDVIDQMYKVRDIDVLSELYKNPFSHELVQDLVEKHVPGF